MIDIFKRVWTFSTNRHDVLAKGLILNFIRSFFGATQLIAIIIAVKVIVGSMEATKGIWIIVLLCLLCIVGNFVISYVDLIATSEAGFFMIADKRVSIGNLLRRFPLGFFNDASSGRICATLSTTLAGAEQASTMVVVGIISGIFNSFSLFIIMFFYEWKIGLLSGVGIIAYLLVVGYQMKVSRKNAPALQEAQTALADSVLSFLRGIKVTKAFRFDAGDQKLRESIQESSDANIRLTSRSMPSQYAAFFCLSVFESLILFFTLYEGNQSGMNDPVKMIVLIIFSFIAYAALNQAGSMLSMIGILDASLREVESIEKEEQLREREPLEKSVSNDIVFENVSFSYGDREVLHHINLKIPEKSLTAVIGPSGSGKTTLCQLIPRFRDVSEGKITIGSADVRNMKEEELMSKISMVFQQVYLFEDTILNNIRFGKPDATLEEVRKVAKAAKCDDFIMALENDYETVLKEGGNSLSGGEKQRISIARAMLKDSPIIILDEATSALDVENEHEILSAIDELTKDKTVIMIAHRIKTVKAADKIIALEDGSIVQEGSHEELKETEGLYANFLKSRAEAARWQL